MKKLLGLLLGLLMVFGVLGSASAVPLFVDIGDSSSVDLDVDALIGGLVADLNPSLGSLTNNIADGTTWEIDFFTLTATEASWWRISGSAGTFGITATLDIETPDVESPSGSGSGGWGSFNGWVSGGVLTWDPTTLPDVLTLDDGSTLSVDFQDGVTITCGTAATVKAYLTYDAVAPVPEPATLVIFGIGLLCITGASRKKSA